MTKNLSQCDKCGKIEDMWEDSCNNELHIPCDWREVLLCGNCLNKEKKPIAINYNFVDMSKKIQKLIPSLKHLPEELFFDCNFEELMLNLKEQGFI